MLSIHGWKKFQKIFSDTWMVTIVTIVFDDVCDK